MRKRARREGFEPPRHGDSGFQIHRNTGLCDLRSQPSQVKVHFVVWVQENLLFLDNMNALAPTNAMMDEVAKNGIILSLDSITPSEIPNSSRSEMKSSGDQSSPAQTIIGFSSSFKM